LGTLIPIIYHQQQKEEAKRVDERRDVTRIGAKKEHHVTLTVEQTKELKT